MSFTGNKYTIRYDRFPSSTWLFVIARKIPEIESFQSCRREYFPDPSTSSNILNRSEKKRIKNTRSNNKK